MDMVRFSTDNDPGFLLLVGVLKRWIDGLQKSQLPDNTDPRVMRQSPISISGSVRGSNIITGQQTIHGPMSIGATNFLQSEKEGTPPSAGTS